MRSHCFVVAAFVTALGFAAPRMAFAGDAAMDAFVREVLARNPSIHARALRTGAFRAEASAASLWPDPQVSVMVDRVPGGHGAEMPMLRYQAAQMIPWPGKLGLARDAIERQADAAAAEVELRKLDLTLEAKRGFLMLVLNARTRQVNGGGQELVTTITTAALARYAAGTGGHHEVARAQVERSALDVERLDLEGERASIVAMLNALRNQPPARPIADPADVQGREPAGSVVVWTERALESRPELAIMRSMQREQQAMGAMARRERYPDLMASVWYNQMLGAPDTAGAMLGVTLPIFGVSRQSRRATALDARAAALGEDLAAMQAMIRFEVADAARKVDTANRELALLQQLAVPRVEQSFESSLAGYATGTIDIVGVLDARRSLQQIGLAVARAQTGREVALAELERAVGGPLPAGHP